MPDGYRVNLGDGVLDIGDAITDPLVTFTTQTDLGAGQWIWSGTFGGTTYTNETEPGTYVLSTDGFVYFVPSFGPVTTISSASVVSAPAYSDDPTDNFIEGTFAGELIDTSFSDAEGDQVDDGSGFGTGGLGDYIEANAGDDTVQSGAGDDSVIGGLGNDEIDGGAGDDTISGDGGPTSQPEFLDWTDQGGNGTDLSGGFTQNTGAVDVTVSFSDDGNNNPTAEVSTAAIYADTGDPFGGNSSIEIFGDGDGATGTATLSFAGTSGAVEDEVTNVSFRISDIDSATGNHIDVITVTALDADGNPVTVTFTVGGDETIAGNTITAGSDLDEPDDANGSVLVEIAGPVQQVQVSYSNNLSDTHLIHISDVHFDAVFNGDSDDSISGGAGDDVILGEEGDDTLIGGAGADSIEGGDGADSVVAGGGDTARGGDGDDVFTFDPTLLDGNDITIVGGEGDETSGDTLDLSGVLESGTINITNSDDNAGGLSGTATLTDGSVVTFSEIETIICFTEGTAIQTPYGERKIETLKPGDLVLTIDNGPQPIRWIGRRTVPATGKLAPVRFAKGAVGNYRDLLVSPQHRMLQSGYLPQLQFGETEVLAPAKALVNEFEVTVLYGGMVTYLHMLFDRHELVVANGSVSESFLPGDAGIGALSDPAREELFAIFPELRSNLGSFGQPSRVCLRNQEARVLARA